MKKRLSLLFFSLLGITSMYAQQATVSVSKEVFRTDEKIRVEFKSDKPYFYGWVAIYGQNQDITYSPGDGRWEWTDPKTSGAFEFKNPGEGRYFAIYMEGKWSYSALSERVFFYVTKDGVKPAPQAEIKLASSVFTKDQSIDFNSLINKTTDNAWVAIYPPNADLFSASTSAGTENENWRWINGAAGTNQAVSLSNPGIGRWIVVIRSGKTDRYSDVVSEYAYFDVVERIAKPEITTDKALYDFGDNVTVRYKDLSFDKGEKLRVYHNTSRAPLKAIHTLSAADGEFVLGSALAAGKYRVVCERSNGVQVGTPLQFSIAKPAPVQTSGGLKIGIMTDVHIMAPQLVVKDGTAFQEYLKEDRKLLQESAEIAKALAIEFEKEKPQVILVAGDLTKDGERVSHEMFVSTFRPLVNAGTKIIVVPGNHDINNPNAVTFNGDNKEYTTTVSAEEFAQIYNDFGFGDAISRDPNSLSYVTEPIDGLRILALDVCKYYDNTYKRDGARRDSCVTEGLLKPETIEWLNQQAKVAKAEGKQMMALLHHNLIEHFNGEAAVASPYLLDNYLDAQKVLMNAGISVAFTGHFHSTDIKMVRDNEKYLYEVETGAPVTYPCPYRIMTLNDQMTNLKIDTRYIEEVNWDTGTDTFQEHAQKSLAHGIPTVMKWLVNDYYDQIVKAIPSNYNAFISIPEREQLGEIIAKNFGVPATDLMLTHNEGNEHLKETQYIMDAVDAGIDGLAYDISKLPGTSGTIASEIKKLEQFAMLQVGLKSILGNRIMPTPPPATNVRNGMRAPARVATNDDEPIDDMSPSIPMPPVSKVTTGTQAAYHKTWSVYPNPATVESNVTISTTGTDKGVLYVYNANGQQIDAIQVQKSNSEIPYRFVAPGVYMLSLNGENKQVIVK